MVQVLQILQASESDAEEDYNQIMLENGDWCPVKLAWEGDLKEVQGLFDKQVFTLAGKQKPEGRYISMRMIRRWKADGLSHVYACRMWHEREQRVENFTQQHLR